jgi:hypothetical protein
MERKLTAILCGELAFAGSSTLSSPFPPCLNPQPPSNRALLRRDAVVKLTGSERNEPNIPIYRYGLAAAIYRKIGT